MKKSNINNFTRGTGVLENLLSNLRAQKANSLIDNNLRAGKVLDIGCGLFPYFLSSTEFKEKYGIDKYIYQKGFNDKEVHLKQIDVENEKIPFPEEHFDVVVMLAVFEHIKPENLEFVIGEIFRVLKKNGQLIVTTPSQWSVPVLHILSRINIISKVEIDDHKNSFSALSIADQIRKSGFNKEKIKKGYFELFLNMWFMARK
ncbi:class I SAM-dependent methyltransferase [Candidatus Parcubacteria bacterium]|nr:MAG: class I SAM-dependent methyltransferase [Candidatus Parcubacteria bacterium]